MVYSFTRDDIKLCNWRQLLHQKWFVLSSYQPKEVKVKFIWLITEQIVLKRASYIAQQKLLKLKCTKIITQKSEKIFT